MVLNEAKLRVVVREELHQYLIEEGFFDKIKSGFQNLTGRGQTQQPSEREQALARLRAQSPAGVQPVTMSAQQIADQEEQERKGLAQTIRNISNDDITGMLRGKYLPITSEKELKWVVDRFENFKPQIALIDMFKQLNNSILVRVGHKATQAEKNVYGVLLSDIEKRIRQEQQGMVQENYDQKSVPLSDQEIYDLKKKFVIPASLWGKTALAFSDFIFDYLVDEKQIQLKDLFANNDVLKAYNLFRDTLGMSTFNVDQKNNKPQLTQTRQHTPSEKFFKPGQNIEERKTFKRKK